MMGGIEGIEDKTEELEKQKPRSLKGRGTGGAVSQPFCSYSSVSSSFVNFSVEAKKPKGRRRRYRWVTWSDKADQTNEHLPDKQGGNPWITFWMRRLGMAGSGRRRLIGCEREHSETGMAKGHW
jgi:hypothetical protein